MNYLKSSLFLLVTMFSVNGWTILDSTNLRCGLDPETNIMTHTGIFEWVCSRKTWVPHYACMSGPEVAQPKILCTDKNEKQIVASLAGNNGKVVFAAAEDAAAKPADGKGKPADGKPAESKKQQPIQQAEGHGTPGVG
jgi:hypothetical protein